MPDRKFIPKPGQVDYTNIRYAPTVNIVVAYKKKIFLVKRAQELPYYPGCWDWICGFLDDKKSIEEKAYEELKEELDIEPTCVASLTRGEPWLDEAPEYNKTWIIVPVLAELKSDKVSLNWEASEGNWFSPKEILNLDLIPGSLRTAAQFYPGLARHADGKG